MPNELKIIKNGIVEVVQSNEIAELRKNNSVPYPFGEIAKSQGESPLKMKIEFTDGNIVGFRGDLKTAFVSIMAVNLSKLLRYYTVLKVVKKAIIYDNRDNLVINKVILHIEDGKVKENLLPLYIPNYQLK